MRRVLTTFALGGEFQEYAKITYPRMREYCVSWGYDFFDASFMPLDESRPASWRKLPVIKELLKDYDEVLWVDADVFINARNIYFDMMVPREAWQAMVLHHVAGNPVSYVPNCGVWLVRRPMIPVLNRMWEMTEYIYHCNWEQAALIKCLGGNADRIHLGPMPHWIATGELDSRTHWLPYSWNTHPNDIRRVGTGHYFYHATMYGDRLGQLKLWEEMYG